MSAMTISSGVRGGVRGSVGVRGGVAPAAAPMSALRLTRRGRLLLSAVALLLLVAAAVVLAGGPAALAGTNRPSGVSDRVTVRPGETLWGIAQRVAPGADPRETVQDILDLNGLQTAQVQAGTALVVPRR